MEKNSINSLLHFFSISHMTRKTRGKERELTKGVA